VRRAGGLMLLRYFCVAFCGRARSGAAARAGELLYHEAAEWLHRGPRDSCGGRRATVTSDHHWPRQRLMTIEAILVSQAETLVARIIPKQFVTNGPTSYMVPHCSCPT
jgi:hypothetical protein